MNKNQKKKATRAWLMYDWANSAFATTIMAAVLPTYFRAIASPFFADNKITAIWGYAQAGSLFIIAFLSPILGAISDFSKSRMRFLKFFAFMGMIASSLLFLVTTGDYVLCLVLFIFGSIGFSGGNVFYDSFLKDVADDNEMDYISSKGYAMGYLGGGILLAINIAMIMSPKTFGIPTTELATRWAFVTVGLWWLVFSIPLFRHLKEDKAAAGVPDRNIMFIGFERVKHTVLEISKYKELTKFLIAFWLYNDGINTIIKMATIYGSEIGIGTTHMITALLITQFVGIPFSLLFGKIARPLGVKKSLYLALGIYTVIVILGWRMDSATEFYILAGMVGLVQGGAQALSRSLYGSMIPKAKSAEFFGFMGVSTKFAAIFGPLVFGLISDLTGSGRNGIFALIAFFIIGATILSRVDIEKGRAVAQAEDRLLANAAAINGE